MRKHCSALALVAVAFVSVQAPGQAFLPIASDGAGGAAETLADCPDVFEAARVADFAVDGDLDKAVWESAKPVTAFESRNPRRPMDQKGDVRLLYSDTALYVGATLWQPMATMHAEFDQHDMPVYNDDSLEMFLFVPSEKGPLLYHWAFNALGAYFDARGDKKTYWTKKIKVRTRRFDDRWTLEVRLPFAGIPIERPFAGDFLGLRFCRRVNEPKSVGAVPYLKTSGNNQRSNFGKLFFAAPTAGLSAAERSGIDRARRARQAERVARRLEEVRASVEAQESALTFWKGREHPALAIARQGVAQMRAALSAFEKAKAAGKEDEKSVQAFFDLAAGFEKFVSDNAYLVWQASPWETGSANDLPPAKGVGLAPLSFRQAGNEREAVCLCFAGLLCGARHDLRVVPQSYVDKRKKAFVSCDQFEVCEEPYVLLDGEVVTAPLVKRDGNIVTLTPGRATRVWIVFNSRGVEPGAYPMSIALKPAADLKVARRELRADVTVWNFTLPETRDWPVKSFFWGPNHFVNDEVQALEVMHDHHVTHGWTKAALYQFGVRNHAQVVRAPKGSAPDYDPVLAKTANEPFFRAAKDLGMRFVFGWGTPKAPSWFRLMSDRLKGMGFASEDFVFKTLIKDEFEKKHIPAMADGRAAVFPDRVKNDWWFQAVYLSVPPPAGATMDDIEAAKLPEFYRMWTLIRSLAKDPGRGADAVRRLKAKGCSVWTYECARYMQTKDVLGYYRFYPLEAYTMGLDGAAVWCAGTRAGDDGFDASDGYDDGALWCGNGRKYVTTKRFEAFREGLEDVAYLDRLKREIARVKASGGKTAAAEALIEAPKSLMAEPSQEAVDAWRLAVGETIDRLSRR